MVEMQTTTPKNLIKLIRLRYSSEAEDYTADGPSLVACGIDFQSGGSDQMNSQAYEHPQELHLLGA